MCLCYGCKIVTAPGLIQILILIPPRDLKLFKPSIGKGLFAITVGDVDAAETIFLTGAS